MQKLRTEYHLCASRHQRAFRRRGRFIFVSWPTARRIESAGPALQAASLAGVEEWLAFLEPDHRMTFISASLEDMRKQRRKRRLLEVLLSEVLDRS
jgi:hypothetical protein